VWLAWVGAVIAAHVALLAALPTAALVPLAGPRSPRIDVAFVQTLQPTAVAPAARPVVAGAGSPPRAAATVWRELPATPDGAAEPPPSVSGAASAAEAAGPSASVGPIVPADLAASVPMASLAGASAAEAAEPLATVASAPSVDWPPSTRLAYAVLGHFRGPAEGQAEVQWRRTEDRYEVEMTLSIGPRLAPLATRTVRSEGRITAQGLAPRRYDEETRALFGEPRRLSIELGGEAVVLPSGQRVERPVGVQDSASQFVQLTWMFTVDPSRLEPGRVLELPLALPRRVEPWVFDVIGPETLHLPPGAVETVNVRPRREARPGSDLTAEVWIAPSLQYLPVRILIRQSADTWLDLTLQTWPQQAAPTR
jgi:hypothetical protein